MRTFLSLATALCLATSALVAQGARKPVPAPADVKAPPAAAKKTASGLAFRILTAGKGKTHPGPTDIVTVNYTGWQTDGRMFDTTAGDEPLTIGLDEVIKGWTEGVQLMTAGEKRRFWIPVELAYNNRANKPVGMLVFDIELLSFKAP